MNGHRFDPTILREYDIRGIVGETLTTGDAKALGRSFGTVVARRGGRRICVGRDGRLTSPDLEDSLVAGLNDSGIHVVTIGLCPTPALYFAVQALDTDGGVMVTGSHNPPEYNGFKMTLGTGSFFGNDIRHLGELAAAGDYTRGSGQISNESILERYVDRIATDCRMGNRNLAVAWDSGNGSAGEAMEMLTARLPGRHVLLNSGIDGTFPAHHPDPTVVANLEQLIEAVQVEQCDLGIAFDGDGDRIGVIDGEGQVLWGDQLMTVWAEEVLAENPGATIMADVKASQVLFDRIGELGGLPLMWQTGHSLIKAGIAETGALLAGEMSGHVFFADKYYGYDDALYAAGRLLSCLSRDDRSLAEIRKNLPQVVNTPEIRFPCPEERKFEVVEEVRKRLAASGANVCDIDGVRVLTENGWWLLRSSNTQAALVARCEAATIADLELLKEELASQLRASGLEPPML